MTPLELSYPVIGSILALGGGIYAWQTRRNCAQALADLQGKQAVLSQSPTTVAEPIAPPSPSTSEAMLHIQGKLRHLEQDLQKSQTTLQATLAEHEQLSQNYRAQEQVLATLRNQLSQQQTAEGDRLKALQQQNQELLQENSNLSDRLRQSVNSLAEARPKLLQLQGLDAKNQQLSEQLQRVKQDQQTEMAQQLAEREQLWDQQKQELTAQIRGLEVQVQQLTTERDQLHTRFNNLEATQKSLTLTNQELTIKLETTQAQGDRLKAEKKEQGAALQLAQGEMAKLQQQLTELAETQAQSIGKPEPEPEVIVDPVDAVIPEAPIAEPTVEPDPVQAETDTIDTEAELEPEPEPELIADAVESINAVEPIAEPVVEAEPEAPIGDRPLETHPLTDKKVVILGTLNSMNREVAKTRLQGVGAECTSAPSSKTDYVVVGKAPGVKLKKAQKLGIPQLSEAQFLELLGE